jgi:hypothetical protein
MAGITSSVVAGSREYFLLMVRWSIFSSHVVAINYIAYKPLYLPLGFLPMKSPLQLMLTLILTASKS